MHNITQRNRNLYRRIIEDKGVPEVIAFMAAQNITIPLVLSEKNASLFWLLSSHFVWKDTKEGCDFWAIVAESNDLGYAYFLDVPIKTSLVLG